VKLAAKRESFMLEGRFTGDEEEAKVGDQMFEIVARISIPLFLWGILSLGEWLRPQWFVTQDCWNSPQAMNTLRSRIYRPKRHSAFLFL
jgi:hypothetical protein